MPTPEETQALFKKAEKLNEEEKYQEVIDLLTEDTLTLYNSAELYTERARAHGFLKQSAEQISFIEKAFLSDQKYYKIYNYRGNWWFEKKEFDKAIDDYSKAIELNPDYATAYSNRGIAYHEKKEFDKAIEDYTKAIELNPYHVKAFYNRGLTYHDKNELNKAIEDYNKAIQIKPDYADAYNNRGNAWLNKTEFDKALEDYNKSIELYADATAYNNRGWAHCGKEEYNKAIEDFNKAIGLEADFSNAYWGIGVCYESLARYEEAIVNLQKAIDLSSELNFLQSRINSLKFKLGEKPEKSDGIDDAAYFFADLFTKIPAAAKKKELKEFADQFLSQIAEIKKHTVLTEPAPVAHYTKLWVADALIARGGETFLRYSNVANMNDPEEGKILKDILTKSNQALEEYFKTVPIFSNGDTTDNNIYLGSFLPACPLHDGIKDTHEDELVMWRTYGKDELKNEAAGCSIVLNPGFFDWQSAGSPMKNLQSTENIPVTDKQEGPPKQPQNLYRVIYYSKITGMIENKADIKTDKLTNDIEGLKKTLSGILNIRTSLINQRDQLLKANKEPGDLKNIDQLIDGIIHRGLAEVRYFFKSANYAFENEYRVIQHFLPEAKEVKFDDKSSAIPRTLYVESNKPVAPHINRIYLGPMVPHPERWMYLEVALMQNENSNKNAKVLPSSCKFQ